MKRLLCCFIVYFSTVVTAENAVNPKAVICAACHGAEGKSPQPQWPNLAGQNSTYLIKQLQDIKKGELRQVPEMQAILAGLNAQEIEDLAQYYATMPTISGQTPPSFVKRGEQLYRGGDISKHIVACSACHGPTGKGNAQAGFPALAGQNALYTLLQLQAFKEARRKNDLNHIMQDISKNMSDEDMKAVAHYVEGLYS